MEEAHKSHRDEFLDDYPRPLIQIECIHCTHDAIVVVSCVNVPISKYAARANWLTDFFFYIFFSSSCYLFASGENDSFVVYWKCPRFFKTPLHWCWYFELFRTRPSDRARPWRRGTETKCNKLSQHWHDGRTAAHVATPRERNQEEESVRGNQMPLNTSEVYSVHVHVSNQRPSSSTQLAAAAVALIATKPEKQKEWAKRKRKQVKGAWLRTYRHPPPLR